MRRINVLGASVLSVTLQGYIPSQKIVLKMAGGDMASSEQVLFREGNVLVTTTQFVVDETVYPISGITIVKRLVCQPVICFQSC